MNWPTYDYRPPTRAFPGGSVLKNLLANVGHTRRGFNPSHEDALEKEMATHYSILAWEIS